jgi:DNA primase large subunit
MFTKLMSREEFVKKHAYSLRHMYGKEGARKNYTPYSCMRIIMGTPPEIGAHHVSTDTHFSDTH